MYRQKATIDDYTNKPDSLFKRIKIVLKGLDWLGVTIFAFIIGLVIIGIGAGNAFVDESAHTRMNLKYVNQYLLTHNLSTDDVKCFPKDCKAYVVDSTFVTNVECRQGAKEFYCTERVENR